MDEPGTGRPGFVTAQPLSHLVPLTGNSAQLSLISLTAECRCMVRAPWQGTLT